MAVSTPIAFFFFNRPELTRTVFQRIAAARPRTLLMVSDGPRRDRPGDEALVTECRTLRNQVDWPCDVLTDFADENLGCRRRVSSGLDWVFRTVSEAIVLEDDCLPDPSFFPFCEQLLERYRNNQRVASICGCNRHQGVTRTTKRHTPYSYYFSRYFFAWGWASWRRVWENYDEKMRPWPTFRDRRQLKSVVDGLDEYHYWYRIFQKTFHGEIDTWDYQMVFSCWLHNGLTIVPEVNLVSNLGHGRDATHTVGPDDLLANLATQPMAPLTHPPSVSRCAAADEQTFQNYVLRSRTFWQKWRARIRHYLPRPPRRRAA